MEFISREASEDTSSQFCFNVTEKREVKVLNVFDENEHNLIMAVIGESPEEIVIEDTPLSKEMYDTLKHIAVVYKN